MKNLYAASLILALAPLSAFAVDGQTLINQSIVTAAGGFPYRILQSGSYKLSGNLVAPNTFSVNPIQIQASNVTLDLNGFTISCGGCGSTDIPSGAGVGVFGSQNVVIQNGTVTGFNVNQGSGISFDPTSSGRVDRITASNNVYGIYVGGGPVSITNSMAVGNTSSGITQAAGVLSLQNSTITGSGTGLQLTGTASVIGNTIANNSTGLRVAGGQTAIGLNDFSNTTNINSSGGVLVTLHNNVCGGAGC